MLGLGVLFLVLSLVAAAFGFGVIASTAVGLAQVAFFVFLVLFVATLVLGRRGSATSI